MQPPHLLPSQQLLATKPPFWILATKTLYGYFLVACPRFPLHQGLGETYLSPSLSELISPRPKLELAGDTPKVDPPPYLIIFHIIA